MSRHLYPKIDVNQSFELSVDEYHTLYVECSGNPEGIPVIYLHGGPGGGSCEAHRRYFNPEKYHIILFDQRGCGRSTPSPSIQQNTLPDLIHDIETIRQHLHIEQWLVCGGSWGTTLALAYGIEKSEAVLGFVLRGIFLGTAEEYDWLYKPSGAASFFPEYYRDFISLLSDEQRLDPLLGYQALFNSPNELLKASASKAWYIWESRLSSLEHSIDSLSNIEDQHQAFCMAYLSNHYFVNQCFLTQPLLNNIDKIAHLPATILHGRYDMVCQFKQAHLLVESWPNAQLQVLPQAGHSGFESQTMAAFCYATDGMVKFLTSS